MRTALTSLVPTCAPVQVAMSWRRTTMLVWTLMSVWVTMVMAGVRIHVSTWMGPTTVAATILRVASWLVMVTLVRS